MSTGKLESIGGRWQLRFTRELAQPQEKVWRAITEPEHLQAWFPQHVSGDWVVGGTLTFSTTEGRGPDFDGEVLAYQPQSLVEFRWGTDVIRMELAGRPGGCTLTLLDTFDELGKAARDAAGASPFSSTTQPCSRRSALYQSALISTALPRRGVTTQPSTFASIQVT